jgi:hypothetical protein
MTVNTVGDRITYLGNGSTTQWVFDFPAVAPGYLHVFVTDALGTIFEIPTSAYNLIMNPTVDPNPTSSGGTVVYPLAGPPLPNGNSITIIRILDAVQSVSISNQSVIYPPVIEQEFDYLTLLFQEGSSSFSRAFSVGPSDPIPAIVPPVAVRANQGAFFDGAGNLVPGQIPGPGVFISAVMQPVVEAATIPLAQIAFGLGPDGYGAISGDKLQVNNTYVVTPTDKGKIVELKGAAFYTVTLNAANTYPPTFQIILYNNDTRGKLISISGKPSFILWPSQSTYIIRDSGTGWFNSDPRRWHSEATVNFYVDYNLGSDSSDGLATGNQAFKTIQHAVDTVEKFGDGSFIINLADGVHQVSGGVICKLPVLGADGYTIRGNTSSPNSSRVTPNSGAFAFLARDNVVLNIQSVLIEGVAYQGIVATNGAVVNISNVNWASSDSSAIHIQAVNHSTIVVTGTYHIIASTIAQYHLFSDTNSYIDYEPGTCILDGACIFGIFVRAVLCSVISGVVSFAGGAFSGQTYDVSYNAVATLGGAIPPGNVAGTTAAGGIWL